MTSDLNRKWRRACAIKNYVYWYAQICSILISLGRVPAHSYLCAWSMGKRWEIPTKALFSEKFAEISQKNFPTFWCKICRILLQNSELDLPNLGTKTILGHTNKK